MTDPASCRRALEDLEDSEDAQEAAEILSRIESGQDRTYTMVEIAAELRSVSETNESPDIG